MKRDDDRRNQAIVQALVEFQRKPGQHLIGLRQPATLFNGLKEVLQLASGRGLDPTAQPETAVVSAASFFIRRALLHPDATHYQLLGVEVNADGALIKDRYRLL